MKKRLFSIISIIACFCLVFSMSILTGCGDDKNDESAEQSEQTVDTETGIQQFSFYIEPWIQTWFNGDIQGLKDYDAQYEMQGVKATYNFEDSVYENDFEKAGSFDGVYDSEQDSYTEEKDEAGNVTKIIIKRTAQASNRNVQFTFDYDTMTGNIVWTVDVEQSMGELVGKAGLNTLMGMGTVFIVLIFISFIIALFSILSKAGKKKAPEVVDTPAVVVTDPTPVETSASSDDEIAAVIAAAIAAYEADNEYMEVPADGLIVRSIKKRGFC